MDSSEQRQAFDGGDESHWGDVVKFFRANFNSPLSHEQEWRFQCWLDGTDLADRLDDYDLRGWWLEFPDGGDEYPATWRKPNHLLFDTGSKYHGLPNAQHGGAYCGGDWATNDDGGLVFRPSADMLRSTHPRAWLAARMRTDHPHITLCLPERDAHDE